MHPNPTFRGFAADRNIAFARTRGFGTLILAGDPFPMISHIPFQLNDEGTQADLHLVRSNPIARATLPQPATIAVTGPDAYISPDWYGVPDQVPTWNYVAVHLRGMLHPVDPAEMHAMLDRQSAGYEARLDKAPWTTAKMSDGVMNRMMRQILPFRFEVAEIDGTWKLGQNKPDAVRKAAAERLETGIGSDLSDLAALMRDPPPKD